MIFNQENLDRSYEFLFMGSLFILSVLLIFCIYRAAKGPRIADRLLSINMCGTMTITAICILAVLLGEDYLVDIRLLVCHDQLSGGGGFVPDLQRRLPGQKRRQECRPFGGHGVYGPGGFPCILNG
jgi:multisubunit Na+/H+ antiporter MnhF subunit